MNQAMRSAAYLLKTAQDEIKKLNDVSNPTDAQKARLEELYDAAEKNQNILDELNMSAGFLDPVDPNQLFGGMLGDVPPLEISVQGQAAPFTKTGAINSMAGGSKQKEGGKGKVGTAPENANVRVTAVRPGKGNK
jgi:hypothetical protein